MPLNHLLRSVVSRRGGGSAGSRRRLSASYTTKTETKLVQESEEDAIYRRSSAFCCTFWVGMFGYYVGDPFLKAVAQDRKDRKAAKEEAKEEATSI